MGEPVQFGPWSGLDRSYSDKKADTSILFDSIGFLSSPDGALSGAYDGIIKARFRDNVPTRWLQWHDAFVQLASKPISEAIFQAGSGSTALLVAGDCRGLIYDDKLFLAIVGQPSRVYSDFNNITKFTYLSEKIVSVKITGISGSAGAWTISFAPQTFLQQPFYALFDRDADKGATTARVRNATSDWVDSSTVINSITIDDPSVSLPVVVDDYVRIIIGEDANDLLKVDGFFVWRERIGAWVGNRVQFAGFPGAGTLASFQEPNELDWTFWDALNFRNVGEKSKHGEIKKCIVVDDVVVIGCSGNLGRRGIFTMHGYPAINAQFENTTAVEQRSEKAGFESYDSVATDKDGQTIVFSYSGNIWAMSGTSVETIDAPIVDHPLFPNAVGYIASVGNLIAIAESEYQPDRVATEARGKQSGIMQQVPSIFLLDTTNSAWGILQRVGFNSDRKIVFFDSPGFTGGIGVIETDKGPRLGVGSGNAIYTIADIDVDSPALESFYLQRLQTHRHDFDDSTQKVMDNVTFHVKQRFGLTMPVIIPAEGDRGINPTDVSYAVVRDTVGDITIFSTYGNGGRGSPRLSVGMGYFGEKILAGLDRNLPSYGVIGLNHYPALTSGQRLQRVNISGKVGRIDVFAANVQTLTVLIYEAVAGQPAGILHVAAYDAPRYGHRPSPDFYWFPVEFNVDLSGEYFVEIRGDCDIRTFAGPGAIYEGDGSTVHLSGTQFAMRIVQKIGDYYACDSIIGLWGTFDRTGDVTW